MALWEKRNINQISQVSWTWWTAQDVYYWIDNSFQYSENINTDDEIHGIKLATRPVFTDRYAKCQLVSLWKYGVMALPIDTTTSLDQVLLKRFQYNRYYDTDWTELPDRPEEPWEASKWTELNRSAWSTYHYTYDAVPWVVFQDKFWFGYNKPSDTGWYMASVDFKLDTAQSNTEYAPYDHNDYTDEDIATPTNITPRMSWAITAILNYNNTRLVVAAGQDIWVYYPELDVTNPLSPLYSEYYSPTNPPAPWDYWQTGWKKVLTYEAWVVIVALTCTFEYLKVWAVDEWWNTKVYYYQGNNNLRSTFVYNLVDLTWVRVLHVYSVNWIDYYTSSIAEYAEDTLIDFNKMVWATPVKLFSQRAGMTVYDVNNKAPYFVWPTSISWAYNNGNIYVADAYGVFSFRYTPNWYDKWYMKWKLRDDNRYYDDQDEKQPIQIYWLCENKWILYVSDSLGCRAIRLYDTWMDGYQPTWTLISRQFEGKEWWTLTKMLDEIRLNFELNPLTDGNGEIFVFVSPNNQWRTTYPVYYADRWTVKRERDLPSDSDDVSVNDFFWVSDENAYFICTWFSSWEAVYEEQASKIIPWGWYQVMTITQDSFDTMTEKSSLVNSLGWWWESSLRFDWQTITYAIVITRWNEERATPIVRQIDLKYHSKDKVNNVYNIN